MRSSNNWDHEFFMFWVCGSLVFVCSSMSNMAIKSLDHMFFLGPFSSVDFLGPMI
jgi:hypothetical protein